MVAFPEKRRKERREGHHAGPNPRRDPERSGGRDQGSGWQGSEAADQGGGNVLRGGIARETFCTWCSAT